MLPMQHQFGQEANIEAGKASIQIVISRGKLAPFSLGNENGLSQ